MGKINIYEFEHLLQNPIEQKVQENMLPINFRSHETYNPDEKMSEKKNNGLLHQQSYKKE